MTRDQIIVVSERPVHVTPFRAPGDAPRPAVLLLHGSLDFTHQMPGYTRFAGALAASGLDAYLVHYYSGADLTGIHTGQNMFAVRLPAWSKLVSEVAGAVAKAPNCTGKVGLIGFSNGGLLAVAVTAQDPRFAAAVIYYGGMPKLAQSDIKRLPPLLIFHGDADKAMPTKTSEILADRARRIGAPCEMVVYPGEAHDFAMRRSEATTDALARTVTFLQQNLQG